jgi:hypothetical protein
MTIKKVVDVKDPLLKIVADVEGGRLGVVQASCKILDALRDKGLLYTQPINCRLVGFDPSNRTAKEASPVLSSNSRRPLRRWGGVGMSVPMHCVLKLHPTTPPSKTSTAS